MVSGISGMVNISPSSIGISFGLSVKVSNGLRLMTIRPLLSAIFSFKKRTAVE